MHIGLTERYTTLHTTSCLNFKRFPDIREMEHLVPILLPFSCIAVDARLSFVFDEAFCLIQNFVQFLLVQCQILNRLFDVLDIRFVSAITIYTIDTVLTVCDGFGWSLFGFNRTGLNIFQCILVFVREHFDEFNSFSWPGSQDFLRNFRAMRKMLAIERSSNDLNTRTQ